MIEMTKRKKDDLENAALTALGKRLDRLVNGFRVMGELGQVAAVYWSDNLPGNEVEIALCDTRLSETYSLGFVRQWIAREQLLAGRDCNVHKHGSEWPIIGFTYESALVFLTNCKRLRKGLIDSKLVDELKASALNFGNQTTDLDLTLAQLRPTSKKHVIDLVKLAGVDVGCWYKTGVGKLVKSPRNNPAYCFNWSFGGGEEVVVACLWHYELKIDNARIVYVDNLREHARKLDEVANTAGEDQTIRNRAQTQARRATALDSAFASTWTNKGIVRVIINEGLHRPIDSLGKDSSKVEMRRLDAVAWRVAEYDSLNGNLRLVRGGGADNSEMPFAARPDSAPLANVALAAPALAGPRFSDQHSVVAAEVRASQVTGTVYSRSRAVRDAALTRAYGVCELCGKRGFVTQAGTIYLETHHVQPLSDGGADSEANVVALCSDDHRRAHYSNEAKEIRVLLLQTLAELYPLIVDSAQSEP